MINKKEFYNQHQVCPICFKHTLQTLAGVISDPNKDFVDQVNLAYCDGEGGCGWLGKVLDLVPEPKAEL